MAAAQAAIAAIRDDDLVWRARWIGELLREEIEEIMLDQLGGAVREVRGLGLLIGIEFTVDGLAGEMLLELIEAGVIANHSLNSDRVIRLTPPAVLDHREIEFLLEAVERAALRVRPVRAHGARGRAGGPPEEPSYHKVTGGQQRQVSPPSPHVEGGAVQ